MNNLKITYVDPIDRDYFPDGGFFVTLNMSVPIRMAREHIQACCEDLLTGMPFSGPHRMRFANSVRVFEASDDADTAPDRTKAPSTAPKRSPYEAYVWRTPLEGTPVISIGNEGRMSSVWEMVCETSALDQHKEALIARIVDIFEEMHTRLSAIAEGNQE